MRESLYQRCRFALYTLVLLGALLPLIGNVLPGMITARPRAITSFATTAPPTQTTAPTTPPAQICGNTALLNGPATPPPGAVQVNPGQDLYDLTVANPAGTTFWLAPGTHTLAASAYGQVVPKDGNVYIGAPGAVFDGQSINRYAFTQRAANVTVKYLTITGFVAPGDEAVVNHDRGVGWTIERNTIRRNAGAGAYLGDNNRLAYNCLADNSQYGFQGDGANVVVDHNEVAGNNTYDWEANVPTCGCSGGFKFWTAGPGDVTNNWVHDNTNVGMWWDNNNAGFLVQGNLVENNTAEAVVYETSYNFRIVNNTIRGNTKAKGQAFQAHGDTFPVGTVYISESGGDARIAGGRFAASEIAGNVFEDNWGGVTLWENADRFGYDDSANTSKGYTTLTIDPSGAWPSPEMYRCGPNYIASEPSYSDCRWKTKNVTVTDNDFRQSSRAALGCTSLCGMSGIFANGGTVPTWSPYKGDVIQRAITFGQNNRFSNNRYVGDWSFAAFNTAPSISWDQWRAAPYGQDAGSTLTGSTTTTTPATTTTTAPVAPTTTTTVPAAGTNLALGRPTVASSVFGSGYEAPLATDGNAGTRWASAPSAQPEWIYVDLGATRTFNRVVLTWDPAFGRSYAIQTSGDGTTWTGVYSTTTGDGGVDVINVTASARYVRMLGQVGELGLFSLWEFEIRG